MLRVVRVGQNMTGSLGVILDEIPGKKCKTGKNAAFNCHDALITRTDAVGIKNCPLIFLSFLRVIYFLVTFYTTLPAAANSKQKMHFLVQMFGKNILFLKTPTTKRKRNCSPKVIWLIFPFH